MKTDIALTKRLKELLVMIKLTNVKKTVGDFVRVSVLDSVLGSTSGSVRYPTWDFVRRSVRSSLIYSVRDSVRNSVRNSAWHYIDYDFSPDIPNNYF